MELCFGVKFMTDLSTVHIRTISQGAANTSESMGYFAPYIFQDCNHKFDIILSTPLIHPPKNMPPKKIPRKIMPYKIIHKSVRMLFNVYPYRSRKNLRSRYYIWFINNIFIDVNYTRNLFAYVAIEARIIFQTYPWACVIDFMSREKTLKYIKRLPTENQEIIFQNMEKYEDQQTVDEVLQQKLYSKQRFYNEDNNTPDPKMESDRI